MARIIKMAEIAYSGLEISGESTELGKSPLTAPVNTPPANRHDPTNIIWMPSSATLLALGGDDDATLQASD